MELRDTSMTGGNTAGCGVAVQRVRQVAARAPGRLAIQDAGVALTYQDLWEAAGAISAFLREHGIGPGTRVGVLGNRSAAFICGCLAAQQVGAAFVVLDARWPTRRLLDIGNRVRLGALLYEPGCIPPTLDAPTLELDLAARQALVPTVDVQRDAALYYIFTSGSTGEPKGVAIHHGAFLNFLDWMVDFYGLGLATRTGWTARPGFDASLFEIWPVLTSGGTVIIPADDLLLAPERLIAWIAEQGLTTCFLATPLAELALDHDWPRDMALRCLLTGGDALRRAPSAALPFRLFDHYGPSECTVVSTVAEVTPASAGRQHANIGRPIRNTTVHILGEDGTPIPAGGVGEVVIGGAAVGLGYWADEGLTRTKFVPDPFAGKGALMYRSGDLGRLLPDGTLEFHGRLDRQVKIRGHRIELGEIEHLLMAQEGIDLCAVVVSPPPALQLVAYATPETAGETPWRDALARRLPDYMLPEKLIALERLPLSPNGKVDRQRLSEDLARLDAAAGTRLPAALTPAQQRLAAIWQEVLKHDRFGLDDPFPACGGSSLAAAMVASRVRARWAPGFSIRHVLESPTLRGQVSVIEGLAAGDEVAPTTWQRGPHPMIVATPGQQHMWLLSQMDQGLGAANIVLRIDVEGPLDPTLLAEALRCLARRHALLGSTVQVRDRAVCFVPAPLAAEIGEPATLAGLAAVRAHLNDLSRRPWPADRPPWRAQILRLTERQWVLALILHHALADGWSVGVLLRELGAIYAARRQGTAPEFAPRQGDYDAYSDWLRRWQASPAAAAQRGHWQACLGKGPWRLTLGREKPRPPELRFAGRRLPLTIPAPTWRAVGELADGMQTTPFAALLAALGVLLWRESGQLRFQVGAPIANRVLPETEPIVGLIMNSVCIPFDFRRVPSFRELLADLRGRLVETHANQTLPFETLVHQLDVPHDPSRHPIFQHMLIFQNAHARQVVAGAVEFDLQEVGNDTSRLDLTFCFEAHAGAAAGWLEYSTDLFTTADAKHLADAFLAILEGGIAVPDEVLRGSAAGADVPAWTVAILRQAASRPEAVAIATDGVSLTYRQFDHVTAVLATRLLGRGLAGARVGVLAGNGAEFVVAAFAVGRAGAAYVPLDPDNPPSRIQAVIEDAEVALVLRDAKVPDHDGSVPRETIDLPALLAAQRPATVERGRVPANQEAYILFTSGSTGRPNGVIISHANLNHLMSWQTAYYQTSANDRVSQLARPCFDTSVSELWPTLAVGGTVCIPPPALKLDPDALIHWLHAERITLCDMTTPLAELCLPRDWPADCVLRVLKTGGDRLRLHPPAGRPFRFYNEYGPTECTVISTVAEILPVADDGGSPSIGVPIAGTRVYLLDAAGRLVPPGEPGELCIAGGGVALGYVNRPDLTAERFVTRDLEGQPVRLYRSGDLAAWREDGQLDFRGRLDGQIKIRGFRIEPGEIEARLAAHPAVKLACVSADGRGPSPQLVGWWTGTAVEPGELRAFVGAALPDYMVPASLFYLPQIPLNPNGKIDRKALVATLATTTPAPAQHEDPTEAPRGPLEDALATVWRDLLGIGAVARTERFLNLGGHSILAIQMVAALRQRGLNLSIQAILRNPTLAELATDLRFSSADGGSEDSCLVLLNQGHDRRPPLFLIHSLPGDIIGYGDLVRSLGPEQTCYGIQSLGLSQPDRRHRSIPAMASHYATRLNALYPTGPLAFCGWCYGGFVGIELVRQLRRQGREIALLALIEVPAPRPPFWYLPYFLDLCGNLLRLGPRPVWQRLRSRLAVGRTLADPMATLTEEHAPEIAANPHVATYIQNRQPVYEANRIAGERYRSSYYDGPVTLFCAAGRLHWTFFGETLGWRTLARRVDLHPVSGDHRTVLHGPAAAEMAAHIKALLTAHG